jgi:hypothetical protein
MPSDYDLEVSIVRKSQPQFVTLRRASHITNTSADAILEAIRKHGGWENDKYEVTVVRYL